MIEIYTLGGFLEIGRNMTLIKYGEESILIDMGLHMPNYIELTEDEDIEKVDVSLLLNVGAIPDYTRIPNFESVRAIIPTHAHLDHLGAIPYVANLFPKASILGTSFSCEVLKKICKDERISLNNKVIALKSNAVARISQNLKIRLIPMTHSTPHTVMVVVETPEGKIAYANDFKFDKTPQIGKKPDKKLIKKAGPVKLLIMDTLYGSVLGKTPSEKVAKDMLQEILFDDSISKNNALFVTTFSSHIARIKSICAFGKKLNRKVIFLGRSFGKYLSAADSAGVFKIPKNCIVAKYSRQVASWLKKIRQNPSRYLCVVTGHQAEKKAVLSRMTGGLFEFKRGDLVVFSCNVIPGGDNETRRAELEQLLTSKGVRVYTDIHVSGHASREDHRMLLELIKPEYVIPAHSDEANAKSFIAFVEQEKLSKPLLAKEGDKIIL